MTRPVPPLQLDAPQMIRTRTVTTPSFGLELHWAARANTEAGYRVERQRVADGVWDLFAVTGPDTIFYRDHTVQSGTAYNYPVRALFDGGTSSGWSESGSFTPALPSAPGEPGGPGGGSPDPDPARTMTPSKTARTPTRMTAAAPATSPP